MNRPFPEAGPPRASGEPAINLAPVVLAMIAILAAIHLVRAYALTEEQDLLIVAILGFIPVRGWGDPLTYSGLVSHSLLHAGAAHLLVNSVWLAIFGSPLAGRLGKLRFLVFWAVTAAAGALAMAALAPGFEGVLVGASGAISGMAGAATRFGFRIDRSRLPAAYGGPLLPIGSVFRVRQVYTFIAVWVATNVLAGAGLLTGGGQAIAWQAHLGGFAAGFLLIGAFVRR